MFPPRSSRLGALLFLGWFALVLAIPGRVLALTADDYESTVIEGWTVRVEKSLADHPRRAEALGMLQLKLRQIRRVLPRRALPKLRQVTIWLSRDVAPGAAYHPSAEWLKANGRVVEMAGSIELMNIDDFIDWSKGQPWMVLHELAHAWHHRFLPGGYNHPLILGAYQRAKSGGKYRRVRYYDGTRREAYALTDPMEFFAESTEAYFGRNDFQPFDRDELKAFDRSAYRMVEKAWGVPVRRRAERD
jgi:hypothetical protein